eukprot:m.134391 g.134391  ORF g.134391 m.134391 type:complete len:51 (-) comp29738_c0_seq1:342-494(-)
MMQKTVSNSGGNPPTTVQYVNMVSHINNTLQQHVPRTLMHVGDLVTPHQL